MANWLRLILCVFALVGLLAAGTGGAAAKSAHHCCPETASMTMADHASDCGDAKTLPDCCLFGACAVLPPLAPPVASVSSPAVFAQAQTAVRDDAGPPSRSLTPDLRPPIA